MNHAEVMAEYLIPLARPQCTLRRFDDGTGPGRYDFDLVCGGELRGAVEVTSDTRQVSAQFSAILDRWDHRLPLSKVARTWLLFVRARPADRAWLAELEKRCDSLLSGIENAGRQKFSAWETGTGPDLKDLVKLGVEYGTVVDDSRPGIIFTEAGGEAVTVGPPHVLEAIRRATDRPDNLAKLASAARTERHLFVWVDVRTSYPAWASLNDSAPEGGPAVPAPVTHVWAATQTRDGALICWLWNGISWATHGPFPPP